MPCRRTRSRLDGRCSCPAPARRARSARRCRQCRPECRPSARPRPAPQPAARPYTRVPQSHELFACSSNLPLSLLTGLADGLALKDRATRLDVRDSPQLMGPPLSLLFEWREIQRKCAAQPSRGLLVVSPPTVDSTVQPRTFAAKGIAHVHMLRRMPWRAGHRSERRHGPGDRQAPRRAWLRRRGDRRRRGRHHRSGRGARRASLAAGPGRHRHRRRQGCRGRGRRAHRLARRLGQQRRDPAHRPGLRAGRRRAPPHARGERRRHDERDAGRDRADAARAAAATSSTWSPSPGWPRRPGSSGTRRASTPRSRSAWAPRRTCARNGLDGIHISCVCPDGVWTR